LKKIDVTERVDRAVFIHVSALQQNPKRNAIMRHSKIVTAIGAGFLVAVGAAGAQTPAHDPSARLREVLPADVAEKVLATIAEARQHNLPTRALEQRALKFAAKGVKPEDIAKSIDDQEDRMEKTKDAIDKVRGRNKHSDDEIEAGAEAMRHGVDGAAVSELAKSAPSGRSLAVPLFVIGSLVDRGLPSDEALARVLARLQARASDRDLETIAGNRPDDAGTGKGNRPADAGKPTTNPGKRVGAGNRPSAGPPAGVPANGGKGSKPTTPPGKGKK
jgi:hypothetical protein